MLIEEEAEIPKPALRPIYRLWRSLCVDGAPPTRAEIRLDALRSAAAHALFAVAKVDGIHDNEMSLIREFYESFRAKRPPVFK